MIENTIKYCQMVFFERLVSISFQGPIYQISAIIEDDLTNRYTPDMAVIIQ